MYKSPSNVSFEESAGAAPPAVVEQASLGLEARTNAALETHLAQFGELAVRDYLRSKGMEKTMAAYEKLLESAASEDARGRVRRSMGLKMEQLRGELKMMDSAHDDH